MKRLAWIVGVVVLLAAAGVAWYATRDDGVSEQPRASAPSAQPTRPVPTPTPTRAARTSSCTGTSPFTPEALTVRGVTDRRPVVSIPRDTNGVPGVPPLTDQGKTEFAFDPDQDVLPGDRRGNVLLNAHTWPDGTGLGNRLLAGMRQGSTIVVLGEGHRLCYRVTRRVEVDATKPQPAYFASDGRPQLAIVVCSGERLGPGEWTKRTIWYASPEA
jgi:hypothetical protein